MDPDRTPKVSIIVPLYRSASFMHHCIDSLIGQTLTDIEIILVDDGSPDNSGVIADEYAAKDARIKVVHQENRGASAARNAGIQAANGEYLGFVDSDDEVMPEMYQILYAAARYHSAAMAICNYTEITLSQNTLFEIKHAIEDNECLAAVQIRERILPALAAGYDLGYSGLWNKIYHRTWVKEQGILLDEDRDHGEDWWFNCQLLARCYALVGVQRSLYRYIHRGAPSLSSTYRENGFDLYLQSRRQLRRLLDVHAIRYDKNALDRLFLYEVVGQVREMLMHSTSLSASWHEALRVFSHEEVVACCRTDLDMPVRFKLLSFCIRNRFLTIPYATFFAYHRLRGSLAKVHFVRSTWHFFIAIVELLRDPWRKSSYFERYFATPDPWKYETGEDRRRLERAAEILDRIRTGKFKHVLEIGCAEGVFTKMLAPFCDSLVAVDFAPTALQRARQRLSHASIRFEHLDLRSNPIHGTYDLITAMDVLDTVFRPADLRRIRSNIADALEPGGYLLFTATRQNPLFETEWWGKLLLRGGLNIRDYLSRHSSLHLVYTECSETHAFVLFRKEPA